MSDRTRLRAVVVGFVGVAVLLALLSYFVDAAELLRQLSRADTRLVGLVLVATLGWLVAWGAGLRTVLSALGTDVSVPKSFFIMNGAMFSNNVTPFGQAGGEPVTAFLISQTTDTEYERGLAAITSMDSLNFVPSVVLAIVGTAYYATQTTLGRDVRLAAGVLAVLAVGGPTVAYAVWRYRARIERVITAALAAVVRPVTAILPRLSTIGRGTIRERVAEFFDSVGRVATSRRAVATALGMSALGWCCQMVALWLAFHAVGSPVPFALALFAVPLGALAGATPLPGGAGAIETVLVAVISSVPGLGVGLATIAAAVAIYRGAIYVVPVVIGGLYVNVAGVEYL